MNSYWIESTKELDFKKIDKNYIADVCIIGSGITGLTIGYYLSKQGLKVIILDKSGIGEQTSGNTTAKITYQHGLIYDYLINTFGLDFAFKYLDSNRKAISNIKQIINQEKLECDFEYQNNYIYTTIKEDITKIKNEVNALNTLERI